MTMSKWLERQPDLLARKLEHFARLSPEDIEALDRIWRRKSVTAPPQDDIVRQGDPPGGVRLMQAGWACRYRMLADGRRQILSFFLPGDLCDLNNFVLRRMDHSVMALTPVRYTMLGAEDFDSLTTRRPRLMHALWWDNLVAMAIQREWTVNLGQRSAVERLAHLLCELYVRLHVIGLANGGAFDLPITQVELADTVGLSPVHVSRTLKDLRERNLVQLHRGKLEIFDFQALSSVALFRPDYLHLAAEGAHLAANA
ncbi:MAG: Crp/Fnr family transcriptional regulator [Novosphingobium sp.]|nr:Crp/Fnr family transcriptional regulator [Novosphingobium sp.]